MSKNENEAVKVLQIHIQKLQKQKEKLDQKFKYPHSEEFRQEFINLSREYMSLDKLKQIETIKDTRKRLKALEDLEKRDKYLKKRLAEMKALSDYWTVENIEKNCDKIAELDRKIEQCNIAIMFVPSWP